MSNFNINTLYSLDLIDIQELFKRQELTPSQLTDFYLSQIEHHHYLNTYIDIFKDNARSKALEADERYKTKTARSLEGLGFAIKDLFCTKQGFTTAGSKILEHYKSPIESTVTQRLWDHGAIFLGKVNLDAFGMGSSNDNVVFGKTFNPWKGKHDTTYSRTAGGSSGGSSSAVAAHLCSASMGTDTGGSVRQPASFSGIVGLKPTYGRVSRHGMIAFANSFDQAGILSISVRDSAKILENIAGFDPYDKMTAKLPVPNYFQGLDQSIKGLRVGIIMNPIYPSLWASELDKLNDTLESLGAIPRKFALEEENKKLNIKAPLAVYYVVAIAEATSNLMRYDGVRYGFRAEARNLEDMYKKTRTLGFGLEVQKRLALGAYFTSSEYYDLYFEQAQKVRTLIIQEYQSIFQKFDILISPTTLNAAFNFSEKPSTVDMMQSDLLTVSASVIGYPALSIPIGLNEEGLPLGIQVIAKPFDEATLLRVGHQLEQQYSRLIWTEK